MFLGSQSTFVSCRHCCNIAVVAVVVEVRAVMCCAAPTVMYEFFVRVELISFLSFFTVLGAIRRQHVIEPTLWDPELRVLGPTCAREARAAEQTVTAPEEAECAGQTQRGPVCRPHPGSSSPASASCPLLVYPPNRRRRIL